MTSISISELKKNPSSALNAAGDYPVAVKKRDKTKAYLIGKNLFEKIIEYIEDVEDSKAVDKADLSKATDFEEFARELGI
jgi:antitoxin StbD